jgi:hypothetical protein
VVGCLVKCAVKVYGTRLPPPSSFPWGDTIGYNREGGNNDRRARGFWGEGGGGVKTRMTKTNVSFHTHMIIAQN